VLDGVGRTIVGVMPADFSFPSESSQLWIPLTDDPANIEAHWGTGFMPLVARLRPWATVEQAQDELTALVSRITAMFPYEMARTWNADATVIPLQQDIVRDVRDRIRVLAWAVAFVLLIVCANVGSLLLSRTTTRQPELCVRSALGAGRARLVRQLLTEGLMIAVIGAAAGLVLAVAALSFLKAAFPPETPRLSGARIDVWVVAFTSGLALISGAWLAVVASIQAWTPRGEILRNRRPHAGRGAVRLRNLLITGQVALTVTLTVGAGLLLKSLTLLAQVDPGFRPEHVQIVRVFPDQSTCGTRAACLSFYDELLRRTRAITGVSTVAATNALPLTGESSGVPVEVEDHPLRPREQLAPIVSARAITPEYFRIMRVPVLAGRSFTEADQDGTPGVVLVSAATARRFWPEEPAVGKRLRPVWDEQWRTVIGVVGDVRLPDIEGAAGGFSGVVYMPYPQAVGNNRQLPIALGVVVRTTLDPGELGREFRAVVAGLSEQVPVGEVTTMTSVVSRATLPSRSIAWVFAWFAGAALVLAAVGVYGSVAYSAGQRVFELGVRAALGATRPRLVALVLSQSFASVLVGLVLGVMAALVMSRALAGFLFGVTATDPDTFMQVGLLVVVVALFAAFLPARAASRVDPAKALRAE
jgi:putative ABC transport system permease protein